MRTFVQKAAGLSLTGVTTDQVFFFVYGKSGGNGKSTLINLLRDMLGDYGCHTPIETLLVKQYDNNIPADLARLNSARMVTAIEANFNRHLDEAKIKAMTGGEPIVARFMRQNFFDFTPEFKLWLVANDRPRVRGTDSAFWRRVRVIPLTVKIAAAERDPDLPEQAPGGMAWHPGVGGAWLSQMASQRINSADRRALGHEGLARGEGSPEKRLSLAS